MAQTSLVWKVGNQNITYKLVAGAHCTGVEFTQENGKWYANCTGESGAVFSVWSNDASFSPLVSPNSKKSEAQAPTKYDQATVTITAKFKLQYVVTWDAGGGTGGRRDVVDEGLKRTAPEVSRTGYKFLGWYNSSGNWVGGAGWQTDKITANVTYTAKWQKYCTVTFVDGFGNTLSTQTVLEGNKAAKPANPTKAGYTFSGWSTNPDTTVINGDYVFEARWTSQKLLVRWYLIDGQPYTLYKGPYEVSYGSNTTKPATSPARTGYTFVRWYYWENGVKKYDIDTWMTNIRWDRAFYAEWNVNHYTVVFNKNASDATGTTPSTPGTYDKATHLAWNKFVRNGYRFVGWAKTPGGPVAYNDNAEILNLSAVNNATVNLYAVWEEKKYTVTFYTNGTTDFPAYVQSGSTEASGGIATSVSKPLVFRDGFDLDGFFDSSGKQYGDTINPTQNLSLTARWTAEKYRITISPNGGAHNLTADQFTVDVETASSTGNVADQCFRVGHTLLGYFTESDQMVYDGEGRFTPDSTFWTEDGLYRGFGDYELKAKWEANSYRIRVSLAPGSDIDALRGKVSLDGSTEDLENEYDYDRQFSISADEVTGYKFDGWYSDSACTKLVSTEKTLSRNVGDGDATYYARYSVMLTVVKHVNTGTNATVFINGQQFEGDSPSVYVPLGSTVSVNAVMHEGSFFGGWFSDASLSNRIDAPQSFNTVNISEAKILYLRVLNAAMQIFIETYAGKTSSDWSVSEHAKLMLSGNVTPLSYEDFASQSSRQPTYSNGLYYRIDGPQTVQARYVANEETEPFRDIGTGWGFSFKRVSREEFTNININQDTVLCAALGEYQKFTVKFVADDPNYSTVSIDPGSEGYETDGRSYVSAKVTDGNTIVATASCEPGYRFGGWYEKNAENPLYRAAVLELVVDKQYELTAKFVQEPRSIFRWQGKEANKTIVWSAKKFVGSVPFNPSVARVDATGYPVVLSVGMTSSPDRYLHRSCEINVKDQGARRLKLMRPERYMDVTVTAEHEVDAVFVGTSMTGIRQ